MVMKATVKDLYTLVLKYKEDASKYENMNPFTMAMDIIRHTMFDLVNIPFNVMVPTYPPYIEVVKQQQQVYIDLEYTPVKFVDYIDVEFTIEKNKK